MIYLVYVIFIVAIFHFTWEALLAPSFRLGLRYELFRLRDRLRKLHYTQPNDCNEEVFRYLQGIINNGIRLLPRTDFSLLSSAERAIANDEGLRKRIEKRRELLDACRNNDIEAIERQIRFIAQRAFAVNTGGWAIYVVPIFAAFACLGAVNRFIREVLLVPEQELDKIVPTDLQFA